MEKQAKVVSFFNHKGGVGKTTLVHNLAFALADLGRRVLLLDMDPQMNLTASVFGLSTNLDYSCDNESLWMKLCHRYLSVEDHLRTALDMGDSPVGKKLLARLSPSHPQGRVVLAGGSINLPNIEADLYSALKNPNTLNRKLLSNFERALRIPPDSPVEHYDPRTGQAGDQEMITGYDFILVDTSPSMSSVINLLTVLGSHYFVVPVAPAFFSLQAVDNLSTIFSHWTNLVSSFQQVLGLPGLSFDVRFLGVVVQMGKRFTRNNKKFAKATEQWTQELNISIKRFYDYAIKQGYTLTPDEFSVVFRTPGASGTHSRPFVIEQCCHFTDDLRTRAEKNRIPVIHLTREHDTNLEKANHQHRLALDSIKTSMHKMAADFLNLA